MLHKIGAFAFSFRWVVLGGWIAIVLIIGLLAVAFIKPTSSSIAIPGTEGQIALDRYKELFPDAGASAARIVFATRAPETLDTYKTQIEELTTKAADVDEVSRAVSPFTLETSMSNDRIIGFTTLQINPSGERASDETIAAVGDLVDQYRTNGLQIEVGGDLVVREPGEIIGVGEIAGVVLAVLVLVIMLGSLVAAGLPIIIAVVTVVTSIAGLFAFSQVIEINSTTPALAVMLGLAVGIDYSLFIINRYRNFLLEGVPMREAAGRAVATAGNAVLFAATTVVIALSALAIVGIPFMTLMGFAGAAAVAVAALAAITLTPALLGFTKLRIFGKKTRRHLIKMQSGKQKTETSHASPFWRHVGERLLRHRMIAGISALVIIIALAIPAFSLRLGLPSDEYSPTTSSARKAYDLVATGFGPGVNGPLLVVVEGLPAVTDADKNAVRQQIIAQYAQQSGVSVDTLSANVTPELTAQLDAQVAQYAPYYQLGKVATSIGDVDLVASATPILTTSNGQAGAIQVTPVAGPADDTTIQLVAKLRDAGFQASLTNTPGVTYGVTGTTALQIDINNKLAAALPLYLAVVIGLSLVLLLVAFRSVVIPVKATIGFLLSVLAMFGSLVAVFQWGWFGIAESVGPITSFIPIIAIGILFGLAMDYEFFLVSGMQEAYHRTGRAHQAVLTGFNLGAKVVTAAGVIMVSVFAGFITNHDATIQAIGFGLAVGILVDAFVVRMTLVPIIMSLLGKVAWWIPSWLDRILPHISIEGEVPDTKSSRNKT
jgi:RND superfamily putative drug exporter